MQTLHIRCGTDIQHGLVEAGIEGDFLPFFDPFCVGPLGEWTPTEQVAERARFLATALGLGPEPLQRQHHAHYAALERLDAYARILLWFEHDSFDQTILTYLLARFHTEPPKGRLELIVLDQAPGVTRFLGLGQLDAEGLAWAYQQRRAVTTEQLALGARAWRAMVAHDPRPLARLTREGTPALPLLAPALRRHLQELPARHDGLRLTERLTLQALASDGPQRAGQLFQALVNGLEPLPFLGDTLYGWLLRELAAEPHALVTLTPAAAGEPWHHAELTLSEVGRAVLAGERHRLDAGAPGHWVGGVLSPQGGHAWCWDEACSDVVQCTCGGAG